LYSKFTVYVHGGEKLPQVGDGSKPWVNICVVSDEQFIVVSRWSQDAAESNDSHVQTSQIVKSRVDSYTLSAKCRLLSEYT